MISIQECQDQAKSAWWTQGAKGGFHEPKDTTLIDKQWTKKKSGSVERLAPCKMNKARQPLNLNHNQLDIP
jgi:hypothetical protein